VAAIGDLAWPGFEAIRNIINKLVFHPLIPGADGASNLFILHKTARSRGVG
jgi:hypothetical protein